MNIGLALKRLGGILRSMFLIGLDTSFRNWWLSQLVNVSWLGVSSTDHLLALAGTDEARIRFFSWDLLDDATIFTVVCGCSGVLRVASSWCP